MSDGDKLVAWLREAADEIENAHRILDSFEVPRRVPKTLGGDGKTECTLAARVALLAGGAGAEPAPICDGEFAGPNACNCGNPRRHL